MVGMNSLAETRLATELLGSITRLGSTAPIGGARFASSGNLDPGWHRYLPEGEFLTAENLPSFIFAFDPLSIDLKLM